MIFRCRSGSIFEQAIIRLQGLEAADGSAAQVVRTPQWQNPSDFPVPMRVAPSASSSSETESRLGDPSVEQVARLQASKMKKIRDKVTSDLYHCSICYETKQMLEFHAIASCSHPPVCGVCLGLHIGEEINGKGKSLLRCPAEGCSSPLTFEDVQRCASRENFGRYNHLATMRYLEDLPEFLTCTRAGCYLKGGALTTS